MKRLLKAVLAPTVAAILVACGGGGGGSASSSVNLSGSAGKGLLIGADVKAYEVIAGKQQTSPWATGRTGSDGRYALQGAPTSNPIVVVVTANANTKMLDETQPLGNGTFQEIPAAANLTLRSFVEALTQDESVQVNPLTENAVLLASTAKDDRGALVGLTKNSLLVAKQYAQQMAPEGVNPFVAALPSKPADLSDDKMAKMGAMMAGLIQQATANCDIQCQIGTLSKDVEVTLNSSGAGTIPQAKAQEVAAAKRRLLETGKDVFATKSNVLGADLTSKIAVAANAAIAAQPAEGISTTTVSAGEYEAINGVQGFINALRNSFKVTEEKLVKAKESLDTKYQKLTFDGLQFVSGAADRIVKDCVNNKQQFACTTAQGSSIAWRKDGNDWVGEGTTDDGYQLSGRVRGNFVPDSYAQISIVSASVKAKTKTLVEMSDLGVTASGTDTSGIMTLSGSIMAYDQTVGSDLAVTLELSKLEVKGDEVQKTSGIVGQLVLSSNKGDRLAGTVEAALVTRTVRNQWGTYSDAYITSGNLTLKASENTVGEILALNVTGTNTPKADLTKNVGATNFDPYDISAAIALSGNTKLTVKMGLAKWDSMTQSAELISGNNKLLLSGNFSLANSNSFDKWCNFEDNVYRCASTLDLIANDGTYKATLKKSAGATTADLYKGSTKIGVVTKDGMIELGGKSYSLY